MSQSVSLMLVLCRLPLAWLAGEAARRAKVATVRRGTALLHADGGNCVCLRSDGVPASLPRPTEVLWRPVLDGATTEGG